MTRAIPPAAARRTGLHRRPASGAAPKPSPNPATKPAPKPVLGAMPASVRARARTTARAAALAATLAATLTAAVALTPAGRVLAAEDGVAGLTADRVIYTSGYRTLRAIGNVQVIYGEMRLEATALTYDQQNGRITAEGPLRLSDGADVVILADYAELSDDMKEAILRGARMVLNRQMQLAAVELRRSGGRYNQMITAAASTCIISEARPTPLWQIRARRIVQDEQEKRLYFEAAQLRIRDIPVAWIPRLSVPDPTIRRARGFLVPDFGSSSTLGASVETPYFIPLGDYADITLKPRIYGSGTATLGFALRRNWRIGTLRMEGALSRDTRSAFDRRAWARAELRLRFPGGLQLESDLEAVSDAAFLRDHGISQKTRSESRLALRRIRRDRIFEAELSGYRFLATPGDNLTRPWILGRVAFRRIRAGADGGLWGLDATATGYQRRSGLDVVGRDGSRLAVGGDWQREWITAGGLRLSARARIGADRSVILQDSGFAAPVSRIVPMAAADLSWPLMRMTASGATQTLTPRLQLVWTPDSLPALPNEDSQLVEFDHTSLFALSRFPGTDAIEQGLRANIGLGWTRRDPRGLVMGATLGTVLRARDLGQFAPSSGLSGVQSSWVLGAQLTLPDERLRLIQSTVFDNALSVSRNETRFLWKGGRWDLGGAYLWATAGAIGNAADLSQWVLESGLNLTGNWRTEAALRLDALTGAAADAALALKFRNECMSVALSLSRRFAAPSNLSTGTSFGLRVSLEGFGTRADSPAYARKCASF